MLVTAYFLVSFYEVLTVSAALQLDCCIGLVERTTTVSGTLPARGVS